MAGYGAAGIGRFFIPNGKSPEKPFKLTPRPTLHMKQSLMEVMIVANFIEVFLAKEGHDGVVGINYLEKVQLPTLPSLFGAMIAGVDVVLMGAGIPLSIPGYSTGFPSGGRWSSSFMWKTIPTTSHSFNRSIPGHSARGRFFR